MRLLFLLMVAVTVNVHSVLISPVIVEATLLKNSRSSQSSDNGNVINIFRLLEISAPEVGNNKPVSFVKLIEDKLCIAGEKPNIKKKSAAFHKDRRCLGTNWSFFNPIQLLFGNPTTKNDSEYVRHLLTQGKLECNGGRQWSKKSRCARNFVKHQFEYCNYDSNANIAPVNETLILSVQLNFWIHSTFCTSLEQKKFSRFLTNGGSTCLRKQVKLPRQKKPKLKPKIKKVQHKNTLRKKKPNKPQQLQQQNLNKINEVGAYLNRLEVIKKYSSCFNQSLKDHKNTNFETFAEWFIGPKGKECITNSLSHCTRKTKSHFNPILKNAEYFIKKEIEPEKLPWAAYLKI